MIEIADIKRIALGENEALWVTLPEQHLPKSILEKQMSDIHERLSMVFLTNRIIITPAGYNFTAITPSLPKEIDDHNE